MYILLGYNADVWNVCEMENADSILNEHHSHFSFRTRWRHLFMDEIKISLWFKTLRRKLLAKHVENLGTPSDSRPVCALDAKNPSCHVPFFLFLDNFFFILTKERTYVLITPLIQVASLHIAQYIKTQSRFCQSEHIVSRHTECLYLPTVHHS